MSDIMSHYGGSILAMRGKSSVAIVSDKRLGMGSITTNTTFERLHRLNAHCYIGFTGFVPDAQYLVRKIAKNHDLFCINERREMTPKELSSLVSCILYSSRLRPYFCEPVIAGIHEKAPFVCNMDQLGALNESDFVASGTSHENLLGMCEALFEEGMSDEDLFVTAVQAFLNSIDRDALSGWGADCYLISEDRVVKRSVKGRQD